MARVSVSGVAHGERQQRWGTASLPGLRLVAIPGLLARHGRFLAPLPLHRGDCFYKVPPTRRCLGMRPPYLRKRERIRMGFGQGVCPGLAQARTPSPPRRGESTRSNRAHAPDPHGGRRVDRPRPSERAQAAGTDSCEHERDNVPRTRCAGGAAATRAGRGGGVQPAGERVWAVTEERFPSTGWRGLGRRLLAGRLEAGLHVLEVDDVPDGLQVVRPQVLVLQVCWGTGRGETRRTGSRRCHGNAQ